MCSYMDISRRKGSMPQESCHAAAEDGALSPQHWSMDDHALSLPCECWDSRSFTHDRTFPEQKAVSRAVVALHASAFM